MYTQLCLAVLSFTRVLFRVSTTKEGGSGASPSPRTAPSFPLLAELFLMTSQALQTEERALLQSRQLSQVVPAIGFPPASFNICSQTSNLVCFSMLCRRRRKITLFKSPSDDVTYSTDIVEPTRYLLELHIRWPARFTARANQGCVSSPDPDRVGISRPEGDVPSGVVSALQPFTYSLHLLGG